MASGPDPKGAPRASWNPWRGAIFSLGLLLAVAALGFSAVNGYWYWGSRRLADPAEFALKMAYDEVDNLAPVDALGLFRSEETTGLGVPYPPPWVEIDKFHDQSGQRVMVGLIVAGAGLLATAASMLGRPRDLREMAR
jgi:hypothetical protein